jgi:hypothetical protein
MVFYSFYYDCTLVVGKNEVKTSLLQIDIFFLVQLHDVSSFCQVFALTFFQTSSNIGLVGCLKETGKVTNSKVCFYI